MPCCPAEVLEVRSLLSAGALDLSFGVGGTGVQLVGTASASAGESATSMAITADGKIVIAGSATAGGTGADFALAELNANGSVNTSFGTSGHVVLDIAAGQNDHINSVAIDAFGRIVVAGTTSGPTGAPDAVVMRFNANGSVDTTFGAGGKVIFDFNGDVQHDSIANAVTVDASGKIVVAGSARIGSGGSATTDLAVARFNADGSVDSSFGTSGEAIIGFAGGVASGNAVTIDANGRIVVAGSASAGSFNELAAVRLTAAGTLDASFGAGGKAVVNLGHETDATQVAIDASGRIVLGGDSTVSGSTSILLTRLNANGSVDGSFGAGGTASASFNSGASETLEGLAIDANGKIVAAASLDTGVAGAFDVGVARFNANGTLDTSFGVNGKVRERFSDGLDAVAGVMIDANGRLVVGGSSSGDSADLLALNFAALQLDASAAVTTSTFRPLNLSFTGTLAGTAGLAGAFSGLVTGTGTVNFTSATQGSAASLAGAGIVGPVTFTGLTNVSINDGKIQATVNGIAAGIGAFSAAATGTVDVSTAPYAVTLSFSDAATGVNGTFNGTISDTTGLSSSVSPSGVTFSTANGLNASVGVSGNLLTAATMGTPAASVAVFWATGTTLGTQIGTSSIVDPTTLPVFFDTATMSLHVSTDDLGAIPPTATHILVVTDLNGAVTVSSAVVPFDVPDIAGTWYMNGQACTIGQSGSSLTFTNEHGGTSTGSVTSSNTVQATQWGNLDGTLTDNNDKLSWANGSVWTRAAATPVNIAGDWVINGQHTSIVQSGANLTFTNEHGASASGMFIASDQIEATGWGNLQARLVNADTEIDWGNGSTWLRAPFAAANIAGAWVINGQTTSIAQLGTTLTFTNEHGSTSPGFFSAANQITASGWGNLTGRLSADNTIIHWANGSVWTRFVASPPNIAGGWHMGTGLATQIAQSGSNLTFTNEFNATSSGEFVSLDQVDANNWGDLVGVLSNANARIDWENGTYWTKP